MWRDSRGVGKWECIDCKTIDYCINVPGYEDVSDQLDN